MERNYYIMHAIFYGDREKIELKKGFPTEKEAIEAAKIVGGEARKAGVHYDVYFTFDYALRSMLEGS